MSLKFGPAFERLLDLRLITPSWMCSAGSSADAEAVAVKLLKRWRGGVKLVDAWCSATSCAVAPAARS